MRSKGKGIWQYTESGLWEPATEAGVNAVTQRTETEGIDGGALRRVLAGRTKWVVVCAKRSRTTIANDGKLCFRPKMSHSPYLQITLSARPLEGLEREGATCQYMPVKKKQRGKKGSAKKNGDGEQNEGSRQGAEDSESVESRGTKRKGEAEDREGKKRRTDE